MHPATITQGNPSPVGASPATDNRILGYCYDAAGNLLIPGACGGLVNLTYTYDTENRIVTTGGVTYTYDGDGKRVKKSNGKLYWTGMGSDPLAESDLAGNISEEYIFFNGKRVARRVLSTGAVFYYFGDHLGTSRVILQSGATTPCYDADYYPFGGERIVADTCPQNYKFTGKERDLESGLDYFGARHHAPVIGRFLTVDPSRRSFDISNPQSLNRYTYVLNNPFSYVDRNGLWPTPTHDMIYDAVFKGVLTSKQISLIKRVSAEADGVLNGGQSKASSNKHGQCSPGQKRTACGDGIAREINVNLANARVIAENHGLTDQALTYFGKAAHTLTDLPSPSHSNRAGDPTTWNGMFGGGVIDHALGEMGMGAGANWFGIGQSVRNMIAGFVTAFPEEAGGIDPDTWARSAIESMVSLAFSGPREIRTKMDGTFRLPSYVAQEEQACACALGNPAACN